MKRGTTVLASLALAGFAFGQDAQQPDPGGWRRIGGGNQTPALQTAAPPQSDQGRPAPTPPPVQSYNLPPTLTIRQGTFVIARLNQLLHSDHNHPGDAFTATLDRPLLVDGFVVARPGDLVAGEVTDAAPGHRGENVSRLGIRLTSITLADGNQIPVQTTLVTSSGPGWSAPDTAAVAGTGAFGAAVGAIAGGGTGAAIGAGAGAFAALAGLLMTKGHPTVLPPESQLTFRLTSDVVVDTTHSPQSFRPEEVTQYSQNNQPRMLRRPAAPAPGYGAPAPAPYAAAPYYGYPYPYAYGYGYPYPYYYGPSVVIGGYYGGGYYHHH